MTPRAICDAARSDAPKIQLRDVWFLVRAFERRGLMVCLNPSAYKGKRYALSQLGRRVVGLAFCIPVPELPSLPWDAYSFVAGSKIRRLILRELSKLPFPDARPATAATIRVRLRPVQSWTLAAVWNALQELCRAGVVTCTGFTKKRHSRTYGLSDRGALIASALETEFSEHRDEQPF